MNVRFKVNTAMLLMLAFAFQSQAVTPLTPMFEPSTRDALFASLTKVGFPEVGQNSVAIAISGTLGFEVASAKNQYDSSYDHLPKVTVVATQLSSECAAVKAVAMGAARSGYSTTTITGTYCLVGRALWKSTNQLVQNTPE
jgi:hypothetical protein